MEGRVTAKNQPVPGSKKVMCGDCGKVQGLGRKEPDHARPVSLDLVYATSLIESLRFQDEDDHEYEIFSILSNVRARTNVILARKCDSYRYSTHSATSFSKNVVVAKQVIKCWEFYHLAIGRRLYLLQSTFRE